MAKRKKKPRKKKTSAPRRRWVDREELSIAGEARYILGQAQRGEAKVVTLGKLLFFSTAEGDAWMLEPQDKLALRLADQGEPLPYRIVETETSFGVEWNAQYALTDRGFVAQDQEGKATVFPTYPVEEIQAGERRMAQPVWP